MSDSFARDVFAWLKQVQQDPAVSSAGFELAFVLTQFTNKDTRKAYPYQEQLAQALGVTPRTVRALLDQLSSTGHLAITGTGGRQKPNDYRMILKTRKETSTFPADHNAEENFHVTEKRGSLMQETRKFSAQNQEENFLPIQPFKQPSKQPIDISAFDDGFSEWYKAYPLHKGRGAAEKAYQAALKKKKATPQELLAGALRYAAEKRRPDGIIDPYTKHPATWLNQECWADEPSAVPIQPNGQRSHCQERGAADAVWDRAVENYRRTKYWPLPKLSLPPDHPQTRVPAHILVKYGYREDAA